MNTNDTIFAPGFANTRRGKGIEPRKLVIGSGKVTGGVRSSGSRAYRPSGGAARATTSA